MRPNDYETLKNYLDENHGPSQMGGVYWIPLDNKLLSPIQAKHTKCQPFYFALDLDLDKLGAELLVRTLSKVKCQCIAYADTSQRESIIGFVDELLDNLDISV